MHAGLLMWVVLGIGAWTLYRAFGKGGGKGRIASVDELYVFTRAGTVQGSTHWVETSFHSTTTGGGGYLHNGTGHVSAPSTTVSSRNTSKARFFVREDDGDELEVALTDTDFAVRDGHQVVLGYAGDQTSKTGWVMGLHNLQTGRRTILDEYFPLLRGRKLGFGVVIGLLFLWNLLCWMFFGSAATFVGAALIAGNATIAGDTGTSAAFLFPVLVNGAGWIFIIGYAIRRSVALKRIDRAICAQLNARIDQAMARVRAAGKDAIVDAPSGGAMAESCS
jgi:hypothetical protein